MARVVATFLNFNGEVIPIFTRMDESLDSITESNHSPSRVRINEPALIDTIWCVYRHKWCQYRKLGHVNGLRHWRHRNNRDVCTARRGILVPLCDQNTLFSRE